MNHHDITPSQNSASDVQIPGFMVPISRFLLARPDRGACNSPDHIASVACRHRTLAGASLSSAVFPRGHASIPTRGQRPVFFLLYTLTTLVITHAGS